jgi:cell division protein FtsW (lipid II flippase)
VVSQYQGQGLSSASQVFLSNDPDTFLDQLTVVSAYNDQQAQLMSEFATQAKQLELRQDCASYQLVRGLYSIASGGFGGTGLGKGTFTAIDGSPLVPYLQTDFIYSAIAQELGLVGAAGLLLVYMLFVVRGMRIALRAEDGFSKLLAAGLTFGFALQTFIIVGGVLRVVPLTGITLPFVSYGGSSIVANFLLLAGLLLVSHRANQPR